MFLVSLPHILLLGALKVSIGDLLQPLLGGLTVNGAADTLGGAEDLPEKRREYLRVYCLMSGKGAMAKDIG